MICCDKILISGNGSGVNDCLNISHFLFIKSKNLQECNPSFQTQIQHHLHLKIHSQHEY